MQYYGLAVVQKDSTIKLTELKGKKSCHTGVDKTVGWKIPVGYLLYTKEMNFTKDQYTSAADFFGESCAPGRWTHNLCRTWTRTGFKFTHAIWVRPVFHFKHMIT